MAAVAPASPLEVRMALAELNIEQSRRDIKDVHGDIREIRKSQKHITGWLIGACFTLTTSSLLLLLNLAGH